MISQHCDRLRKIWDYGLGRMILAAFCVHSVSISIGICQGYSAILLPQLARFNEYDLSSKEMSWIASLGVITNPIGSILSGLLANSFGRKLSIQLSTLPFIAGWLCIAFATNIYHLYLGRLITGIAAGMSAACYTYVSEVSEPQHRGIFQALGPVSASFGILFTYVAGTCLHWQYVAFISLSFAGFTALSVQFVPESPVFLMGIEQATDEERSVKEQTFNALIWFRRSNAQAQLEYQTLWTQTRLESGRRKSDWKQQLMQYFKANTMKPFFLLLILFLLQEMSGIYTTLFYAVNFFEEANLSLDENISSIIVGFIRFVISIVAAFLINIYTRRSLCMVSAGGMALTMGLVLFSHFYFYLSFFNKQHFIQIFQLLCILLNVLFSMTGMLPIPWILVGELFPMRVRCVMSGIVICFAQIFIFVSVKVYPEMIHSLSFQGTIGIFAVSSLLALIFIKIYLPETKNKTLEEIEQYFTQDLLDLKDPEKDVGNLDEKRMSLANVFKVQKTADLSGKFKDKRRSLEEPGIVNQCFDSNEK